MPMSEMPMASMPAMPMDAQMGVQMGVPDQMHGAPPMNGQMMMGGAPQMMGSPMMGSQTMNGIPQMNSGASNGTASPKQKGHARPNGKTRRARAAQQDKEAQALAQGGSPQARPAVPQDLPGSPKQRPKEGGPVPDAKAVSKYSNGLVDLQSEEQLQWLTDDFFMYQFKCVWCPITVQHNWQTCLYAHNYQDARRNPQMGYGPQPCPHWDKKERAPHYGQRCPNGVLCPYSHGAKEQLYHPQYYKTVICWDFSHTKDGCPRGKLCAFYHKKRSQRRGPQLAALARTDYQQLLQDDAMQYIQTDFGCPPFTSSAQEKDMNMAPTIPYAPPIAMETVGMQMQAQMQQHLPQQGFGQEQYWYEDGSEVRQPYHTSPHGEGVSPMFHNGSSDGSPVPSHASPNHQPVFYKPSLDDVSSPLHGGLSPHGGHSSPGFHGGLSPHGVMMVPVVHNSPHAHPQSPMGPGPPMMQGNMMLVPAMEAPAAPFNALYESGPPAQAPPPPPAKNKADDDLFDVKSFDSMELYDQAMPILPPAGLVMNKYGQMTMSESLTTMSGNSGEGTSASASNSD